MPLIHEPAPGFDDPLGLLRACHDRILGHCRTLERLAEHLDRHGPDGEAREAASRVLRYFQVAAPHHHADEEADLFPFLRAHPGLPGPLRVAMDNLVAQHRQIEARWRELEKALEAVARGEGAALAIEPFVSMNRAHIVLENAEILPTAARLLDTDQLAALGEAMRARREE